MDSTISKALKMKYPPVALLWSNDRPDEAVQFKPGRRGCVTFLLASAAKGKVAVADRETFGCPGGGVGLGFGNQYLTFPGGIENFISTGNSAFCDTEIGAGIMANMPSLRHGERYVKNPETAKKFTDALPIRDIPVKYVIFKPIGMVGKNEETKSVIFLANADQLSALVVLVNYDRPPGAHVFAPFGAGCHQIGIFPYREGEAETPRAVIGLTDPSARKYMRNMLDKNILSLTVPFKMFQTMESNVEGSFLEQEPWTAIVDDPEV